MTGPHFHSRSVVHTRRASAKEIRYNAADLAWERPHPAHHDNGDEHRCRTADGAQPSYIANFTKGLTHDCETGLVEEPVHYRKFMDAINSGNEREMEDVPKYNGPWGAVEAGPDARRWESPTAGHAFDLQGPDPQAVTMPPHPALESPELALEMAEVYGMALLRDTHFSAFAGGGGEIDDVVGILQGLEAQTPERLERLRRHYPDLGSPNRPLSGANLYRGYSRGNEVGPHISQFLLAGNAIPGAPPGVGGAHVDGYIEYGGIRIDQRVRYRDEPTDYMAIWDEWLDIQNGAKVMNEFERGPGAAGFHFICAPRDMATYVHFDALYQSYLNACLILLGMKAPFDPDLPFRDSEKQEGFAHFGGPHILTLVAEVATRALKAVRHQKFNIHRRLRPEALAGRMEAIRITAGAGVAAGDPDVTSANLAAHPELLPTLPLFNRLKQSGVLAQIHAHTNPGNGPGNGNGNGGGNGPGNGTVLLPMAFPEGSPMHPAYGAGHATVAGACVTILKAFFDSQWELNFGNAGDPIHNFQPDADDCSRLHSHDGGNPLTVEGELNKLASNISIGRNWAGVHYFTDYVESARMGEEIAIGILQEQKLTYGEDFTMTVPLFSGKTIRI